MIKSEEQLAKLLKLYAELIESDEFVICTISGIYAKYHLGKVTELESLNDDDQEVDYDRWQLFETAATYNDMILIDLDEDD